ncbi:MAG: hypothetical protein C4325_08595 [Blastocatellia bacterium]
MEDCRNSAFADRSLEVTIERILPRGVGLAYSDGKAILVPLAAAGDRLLVRLGEKKGATPKAEIVTVLESGPERISPRCQYYGVCGGCDFQHLSYRAQLRSKTEIIHDCLRRIGRIEYAGSINIVASPLEYGYRLRAQFHRDRETARIGFYRRNSRDVVGIDKCPILQTELNEELARLRAMQFASATREINVAVGDAGEVSVAAGELAPETIETEVDGLRFQYSADVFFQVNRYLAAKLVRSAISGAAGRVAIDLYSGVGLFSLPLARQFTRVVAVEEYPAACRYAKENAAINGCTNVEVINDRVRSFLRGWKTPTPDFILLDPPRAGAERETVEKIIALAAPQIAYVACEPSILARDLKRFLESGYCIDCITAIDLFPQTHHVETVARLSLKV